jgi:hypothetical protein
LHHRRAGRQGPISSQNRTQVRAHLLYRASRLLLRGITRLVFRIRVSGTEHLPRQGGFILAANHISYCDPPLVGTWSTRQGGWSLTQARQRAAGEARDAGSAGRTGGGGQDSGRIRTGHFPRGYALTYGRSLGSQAGCGDSCTSGQVSYRDLLCAWLR